MSIGIGRIIFVCLILVALPLPAEAQSTSAAAPRQDGGAGESMPCVLTLPECTTEGEPALTDDHVDHYNGGCDAPPNFPFQFIAAGTDPWLVWCGVSGWYLNEGTAYRDSDWYWLLINHTGMVEIIADAEYETYVFELAGDCTNVSVAQVAQAGPCNEGYMTITGAPYSRKWIWVGPMVFMSPDGTREYDYLLSIHGLWGVPTAPTTWGTMKALFR